MLAEFVAAAARSFVEDSPRGRPVWTAPALLKPNPTALSSGGKLGGAVSGNSTALPTGNTSGTPTSSTTGTASPSSGTTGPCLGLRGLPAAVAAATAYPVTTVETATASALEAGPWAVATAQILLPPGAEQIAWVGGETRAAVGGGGDDVKQLPAGAE
jgi:hypothetical protein